MSYRLDQGHGVCTYRIGVEDDGCHSLLDYSAMAESARILETLARTLNAVVTERVMIQNEIDADGKLIDGKAVRVSESPVFRERNTSTLTPEEEKKQELLLRKEPGVYTRAELSIHRIETHLLDPSPKSLEELAAQKSATDSATQPSSSSVIKGSVGETLSARNIRVAVVGNVDAGKSTLIGTLTTSSLDDGRGRSRTAIMKHRHEIESGRTSTATTHLMGFRSTGEPIAGRDTVRANKRKTEDEVARESYRIISLMDLAGHEKYLKTT